MLADDSVEELAIVVAPYHGETGTTIISWRELACHEKVMPPSVQRVADSDASNRRGPAVAPENVIDRAVKQSELRSCEV